MIQKLKLLVLQGYKNHNMIKKQKKRIEDVHKKVPNTTDLVKNTDYNRKIAGIESRISYVIGFVNNIKLC